MSGITDAQFVEHARKLVANVGGRLGQRVEHLQLLAERNHLREERDELAAIVSEVTEILGTALAGPASLHVGHLPDMARDVARNAALWREWCKEAEARGSELAWLLDDAKHMGAGVFELHLKNTNCRAARALEVCRRVVDWCDTNGGGDSLYFVKMAREVLEGRDE